MKAKGGGGGVKKLKLQARKERERGGRGSRTEAIERETKGYRKHLHGFS